MKRTVIAFTVAAFMAAPVVSFSADLASTPSAVILQDQDKEKKEVDINKLPNEITAALKGADYAGWTPRQAWKMKTDEGWIYKIKLMKGEETRKVKFTKDGKPLKNMES